MSKPLTSPLGLALLGSLVFTGCQAGEDPGASLSEAELRAAIPTVEQLSITLPDGASSAARATAEGVDDPSQLRQMTYNLATGANQTVRDVLTMIDNITDHPSVAVDEDTRRWGPYTAQGSDVTQVFFMELQEDGDLGYSLRWKVADDPDPTFTEVVSGVITEAQGLYKNHGAFEIDYDAAASIDPTVDAHGLARYEYDTASVDREVRAHFDGVFDAEGQAIDAHLVYVDLGDDGGELGFAFQTDFAGDDGILEDAALHSRWQVGGVGRSDATITHGTLTDDVVNVSECWGQDALLDYRAWWLNGAAMGDEGDGALCAYDQGEFPGQP